MLILALPVMAEEFANLAVGYTDWWLAGRFLEGDAPKAAMSFVAYSMWLIPSFFATVAIGATALVARRVGAGEWKQASLAANQAMLLGIAFSAVVVIVCVVGLRPFVHVMQLRGEAAELAIRYLNWIIPVIPFIMCEQVISACLRASGDTVTGFIARLCVNLVNMIFSAGFVTGFGPFPNLGWEGLAIGTMLGHIVGGGLLLTIFFTGMRRVRFDRTALRIDRETQQTLLRVGLPGGVDQLTILTCHLVFAGIVNRLGTAATAAHGMAIQVEALSYLPGSAFQAAAATLTGQGLGAKNALRAKHSALLCAGSALSIMSLSGLIFFFGGHSLTQFFTGGPNPTATTAAELLQIVAFACPFLAIVMVFQGSLRGAGDTAFPLAITLAGMAMVRIPLAFFLGSVHGAWIGMGADLVVRSALLSWRFFNARWQRVKV